MSFKMAKELVFEFVEKEITQLTKQFLLLLDSSNPNVRLQGINALKKIGSYSEYVPKMSEDADYRIRKAVAEYIKAVGTSAHQPVIEKLLKDFDDRVRVSALTALYTINPSFEEIREYLTDASPRLRARILKIASMEMTKEDLAPLVKDKDMNVQKQALLALIDKTEDQEVLKALVKDTPFSDVRKKSIQKLLIFDPVFVVSYFGEMLQSENLPEKEKRILLGLVKYLPSDIIHNILDQIFEDVRYRKFYPKVLPLFVEINFDSTARVISLLSKLIDDEENSIRLAAVKGFGKLSEPTTVTILRNHLQDTDEKVRSAVVEALSKMLDYELQESIESLSKDFSVAVRKSVIKAIAKLKLEDDYGYLLEKISEKKEESKLRKTGIEQSAKVKYSHAIELLKRIIQDETETYFVRNAAASSLLKISPAAVIELFSADTVARNSIK